jgi:hypothetical protein
MDTWTAGCHPINKETIKSSEGSFVFVDDTSMIYGQDTTMSSDGYEAVGPTRLILTLHHTRAKIPKTNNDVYGRDAIKPQAHGLHPKSIVESITLLTGYISLTLSI